MSKRKVTDLLPTEAILISSDEDLKVLEEFERVVNELIIDTDNDYSIGHYNAIQEVLNEIHRLKPTEIEKLKLAFAEGGAIPQSAESWARKFRQGGC